MLLVEELTKRYGRIVAVNRLSFRVDKGVHGLVGPNGAGKTTTLKSITGLVVPDSGRVLLDGVNLLGPEGWRARKRIGFVPETPDLPSWPRVEELLVLLARVEGMSRSDARRAAVAAMEELGLRDRASSRVGSLSKGLKKRLLIAQALLQPRDLYLLDEPFTGLDPEWVARLRGLVSKLARREGAVVVISSHILRELEALASTVTIIYRGKSYYNGSISGLSASLGVRVRLSLKVEDPGRAKSIVEGEGLARASRIEGENRLIVFLDREEEVADVVEALVSHGVRVYAAVPESLSLEEAYLRIIGVEKESHSS